MSAGGIFEQALRILSLQHLPEVSHRDLLAALQAGHPGPLGFLYEAGAEAGLAPQQLLTRGAAIYFNFCAGNLADDLSDGECTYFAEPLRIGPCTQAILQTLFFHALVDAGLPRRTLSSVTRELIAAVGPQHIEVRTRRWTAPLFREVAEGIAGRQWSAYLQILWCRTPLASRAARVGMNAGLAGHVVQDILSNDPRYTTLSKTDKRKVMAWALAAAETLRREHLSCIDALLKWIDAVLKKKS
jgi:hypothetical protein